MEHPTDIHVEQLLVAAADKLFRQHKNSIGYLLSGKDAIAEANIVIHLASAFLAHGHTRHQLPLQRAEFCRPKRT